MRRKRGLGEKWILLFGLCAGMVIAVTIASGTRLDTLMASVDRALFGII